MSTELLFKLEDKIPFLDSYTFYDKHLTEFYGVPYEGIERVSKLLGHAHSDPIQRLINLTTESNMAILISIASLLIMTYICRHMLVAFSENANRQEEDFKIFCLISNLAIITYITTESFTVWQPILIFSSQALCIQRFFCGRQSIDLELNEASDHNRYNHNLLNPRHPSMLIYPYFILLVVPGMILITNGR